MCRGPAPAQPALPSLVPPQYGCGHWRLHNDGKCDVYSPNTYLGKPPTLGWGRHEAGVEPSWVCVADAAVAARGVRTLRASPCASTCVA